MGTILFRDEYKGCLYPCHQCDNFDVSEWVICTEGEREFRSAPSGVKGGRRRRSGSGESLPEVGEARIEDLVKQLFRAHDLNGNGMLEEHELVMLNEKIAMLHHGQDFDAAEVRNKYTHLFRTKLDPLGRPVPYETFRTYALEVLDGMDQDPEAQELILEQFVAEALSASTALSIPQPAAEPSDLLEFSPAPSTFPPGGDLIDVATPKTVYIGVPIVTPGVRQPMPGVPRVGPGYVVRAPGSPVYSSSAAPMYSSAAPVRVVQAARVQAPSQEPDGI